MNRCELETTAKAIVAEGKGILAADESSCTIEKRFDGIKPECMEEARRTYRELLFTAPNVANYISGVILYDETIRQSRKEGVSFAQHLTKLGIAPGIPTQFAIDANAHALARYAALCQEANIVPIVEPEVLMDGAHSIEGCEEVTSTTLVSVFEQLHAHRVFSKASC
jgi:fructose-bisphosphate aldolase class I